MVRAVECGLGVHTDCGGRCGRPVSAVGNLSHLSTSIHSDVENISRLYCRPSTVVVGAKCTRKQSKTLWEGHSQVMRSLSSRTYPRHPQPYDDLLRFLSTFSRRLRERSREACC